MRSKMDGGTARGLSDEIWRIIFEFLGPDDDSQLRCTSTALLRTGLSEQLWKDRCRSAWGATLDYHILERNDRELHSIASKMTTQVSSTWMHIYRCLAAKACQAVPSEQDLMTHEWYFSCTEGTAEDPNLCKVTWQVGGMPGGVETAPGYSEYIYGRAVIAGFMPLPFTIGRITDPEEFADGWTDYIEEVDTDVFFFAADFPAHAMKRSPKTWSWTIWNNNVTILSMEKWRKEDAAMLRRSKDDGKLPGHLQIPPVSICKALRRRAAASEQHMLTRCLDLSSEQPVVGRRRPRDEDLLDPGSASRRRREASSHAEEG